MVSIQYMLDIIIITHTESHRNKICSTHLVAKADSDTVFLTLLQETSHHSRATRTWINFTQLYWSYC